MKIKYTTTQITNPVLTDLNTWLDLYTNLIQSEPENPIKCMKLLYIQLNKWVGTRPGILLQCSKHGINITAIKEGENIVIRHY
jgi:hypothetical protein